eukprot:TRINITY_DN96858_c0_g1_i1.p1 TRINITY_DN96858_c0_g1~~TRINITY_DN96858_c0_g1_i1.p1  ORF type:complete len:106 (+),score=18.37 TRINITY_DN96858_c0_g1_i1:84-401(+)
MGNVCYKEVTVTGLAGGVAPYQGKYDPECYVDQTGMTPCNPGKMHILMDMPDGGCPSGWTLEQGDDEGSAQDQAAMGCTNQVNGVYTSNAFYDENMNLVCAATWE